MTVLDDIKPGPSKVKTKHKRFIDEYFKHNMNATEAYLVVYTRCKRDSARANGSKLLAMDNIQAEISRRLTIQAMGAEEVLARLANIARASTFPFIRISTDGFVYFDFSNPEAKEYLYLIKKIKTKRSRRVEGNGHSAEEWEDEWVEVELHDAQSALEKIGRYHKLFADRVEVTGKDGGPIETSELSEEEMRKRIAATVGIDLPPTTDKSTPE